METFDVELVKDSRGLGITIAGYVEKTAGKCLVFESLNFSQNSSNFVAFIELIFHLFGGFENQLLWRGVELVS